ncbi:2-C-methyl-D-erythritol 4-phosphate cytidylyltransferase [Eikenella sp. S3360]|uniref:2-C-methyl-D-erythritol 4-phosphate cytidylyltransferase n=1 Tax=Eikenella glucosivorans TaxID=2766967 RepID=A0ABS0NBF7_9NEIS|nr:2-C-methyl-D-erythritol 4-phosphate cytidylyltransferase [Eikenella glucosivorans]MBH5329600.1 2-C-methyl-D-erythritol 4-phosphate cytidylyltransferase [Eikenella glucosivorans]
MAESTVSRYFGLVPAAGVGSRFGAALPKQYVPIAGRTVLEHSLRRLLAEPQIFQVAVVLAPSDEWFERHVRLPENLVARLIVLRCGGASRAQSVANGLNALLAQGLAREGDKILVHDAARCCLPAEALQRLLAEAGAHPVGGILALPAADTLKRDNGSGCIAETVSRSGLWQAQTPQLFAAGLLQRALAAADPAGITDEASAVERLGLQPLLVQGDSRNLKLTWPADERIARLLLQDEAG